jgi:CheY-like chemotaxis protein
MSQSAFTENLSANIKKMRTALAKTDYSRLAGEMADICDSLVSINEDAFAAKYRDTIKKLPYKAPDEIETFTEQFILDISSLSIDLLMSASNKRHGGPPAQRVSGGIGILAVDNAVMFLNTLKRLLANTGYQLHCVTSGEEALTFLQTNQPNVILLDIEMPDMDGYDLARKIKRNGQKAPIIFITANSEKEYIDKAVEVGAAGILMKPLRVNQLIAKLKEFM